MTTNKLLIQGIGCMIACMSLCGKVHAEYAPPVKKEDYPRETVREGQAALRSRPALLRDAFMAERLGLVFESGGPAYEWEEPGSAVKYRPVKSGGKYVSGSGKLCPFFSTRDKELGIGKNREKNNAFWVKTGEAIGKVGDEVILMGASREVTRLVQQTAKFHLKSIPQKRREAFLAYLGDMLYMSDGASGFTGKIKYDRSIWPTQPLKQKQEWKETVPGAHFIDSKGNELSYDEVCSDLNNKPINFAVWISHWCSNLVGAKDILAMFPREVKQMKAAYEKKIQELHGNSAEADKKEAAEAAS